jgi:hypothetical protein
LKGTFEKVLAGIITMAFDLAMLYLTYRILLEPIIIRIPFNEYLFYQI